MATGLIFKNDLSITTITQVENGFELESIAIGSKEKIEILFTESAMLELYAYLQNLINKKSNGER